MEIEFFGDYGDHLMCLAPGGKQKGRALLLVNVGGMENQKMTYKTVTMPCSEKKSCSVIYYTKCRTPDR